MTDFVEDLEPEGSGFIDQLPAMVPIPPDNRKFALAAPLSYDVGSKDSGDRITVPRGFITDFASIPRPLWSVYPPYGAWSGPAIVHDYLYVKQPRTRKESDDIFLEAMKVVGVPWLRRTLMYSAVRLGGGIPWRKRSKALHYNHVE